MLAVLLSPFVAPLSVSPSAFFMRKPGSGSDGSIDSVSVASVPAPLDASDHDPLASFCALLGATSVHDMPESVWA